MADESRRVAGKRLNIAFVVNHAAFFVSHRLPIALEARARGHSVVVFTGQAGSASMEPAAERALAAAGITHSRVAFTSSGMNPIVELEGLLQLGRLMRAMKPDLVHCASPKGILYGAMAARLAGVRSLVLAVSGMGFAFTATERRDFVRSAIARLYRSIVRISYGHRNKRVIVQNGDDWQLMLESRLARQEELVLLPGSGVELERSGRATIEAKEPIVLFPARMVFEKGVIEFVEAARALKSRAPGWRFLMAGAADYRNPSSVPAEMLERFHAEGSIEWLGHVEDMTALYEKASIVCLPSYYREGVPKALLEAAAASCAVVTADSTGCREAIIPGETGDLVPPRSSHALAETLFSLISDRARRESYGRVGRKLATERFGIDAIVGRILAIYEELARNDRH